VRLIGESALEELFGSYPFVNRRSLAVLHVLCDTMWL